MVDSEKWSKVFLLLEEVSKLENKERVEEKEKEMICGDPKSNKKIHRKAFPGVGIWPFSAPGETCTEKNDAAANSC